MGYRRVLPRDLFNESKLLKCVGQLVLLLHDGKAPDGLVFDEETFQLEHGGTGFKIHQADHDGSLSISNMNFYLRGKRLTFSTLYNSKEPYPFYLTTEDYEDVPVLEDDGTFTADFITWCEENR